MRFALSRSPRSITLTTPACTLKDRIKEGSEQAIRKLFPAVSRLATKAGPP